MIGILTNKLVNDCGTNENGSYQRIGNLIIQWGRGSAAPSTWTEYSFPIPYTKSYMIVGSPNGSAYFTQNQTIVIGRSNTLSKFKVYESDPLSSNHSTGFDWIAIGY